ncbi:hypothetical protein BH23ACT5_BH23ACT5_03960 [soil metagenome]
MAAYEAGLDGRFVLTREGSSGPMPAGISPILNQSDVFSCLVLESGDPLGTEAVFLQR